MVGQAAPARPSDTSQGGSSILSKSIYGRSSWAVRWSSLHDQLAQGVELGQLAGQNDPGQPPEAKVRVPDQMARGAAQLSNGFSHHPRRKAAAGSTATGTSDPGGVTTLGISESAWLPGVVLLDTDLCS